MQYHNIIVVYYSYTLDQDEKLIMIKNIITGSYHIAYVIKIMCKFKCILG